MKQNALEFLQHGTTDKDVLREVFAPLISNVMKKTLSTKLKNQDGSGDPKGGSMVFTRLANSTSNPYGTARTAGAGVDIKEDKVIILLDQDKEIVEEIAKKDVVAYGIPAMVEKRAGNQQRSVARELDRAFFAEAVTGGTEFTPSVAATTLQAEIDEMIVALQTVSNDFVDGVSLEDLRLVLSVADHAVLKNLIIALESSHITTADGAVGLYAGIPVYISNRLPVGTKAILMVEGSVAQPVLFEDLKVEEIPLSKDTAVSHFYTYGTKAVTPDLILYLE